MLREKERKNDGKKWVTIKPDNAGSIIKAKAFLNNLPETRPRIVITDRIL